MNRTMHDTTKAFLDAYDQYADAIYRHCFFRVFSRPHAEDLMQETFARAWEYLQKGNDVGNIRALLYRIATNLMIDQSRKKKEESLEQIMQDHPGYEPEYDGHVDIEKSALCAEVAQAIQELPEEQRRLLTLRYVDDLDPKEIAEILDITPNNVSVKLNRAVALLRKELNP